MPSLFVIVVFSHFCCGFDFVRLTVLACSSSLLCLFGSSYLLLWRSLSSLLRVRPSSTLHLRFFRSKTFAESVRSTCGDPPLSIYQRWNSTYISCQLWRRISFVLRIGSTRGLFLRSLCCIVDATWVRPPPGESSLSSYRRWKSTHFRLRKSSSQRW